MAKDRSLEIALQRLGQIDSLIDRHIREFGHAVVLEVGCGYGLAMHELLLRFGRSLSIVGINLKPQDGNAVLALSSGMRQGIVSRSQSEGFRSGQLSPTYVCADAGLGLPFADGSVDIVYSQATTTFIADRIHFLEEINRILKDRGIARLEITISRDGDALSPTALCEIQDSQGDVLLLEEFLTRFASFSLLTRFSGSLLLEIRKCEHLDLGLQLLDSVVVSSRTEHWLAHQESLHCSKPADYQVTR